LQTRCLAMLSRCSLYGVIPKLRQTLQLIGPLECPHWLGARISALMCAVNLEKAKRIYPHYELLGFPLSFQKAVRRSNDEAKRLLAHFGTCVSQSLGRILSCKVVFLSGSAPR
jgi:hypothetical protein